MIQKVFFATTTLLLLMLAACSSSDPSEPPPSVATEAPEPAPTTTIVESEPTYELVWQDEFDGDSLDETKWTAEVHGRPANNELQYYADFPDNLFIADGNLVLQAIELEEKYLGRNYTSARVNTVAKGQWTYGRFEIRAKLPEGQGIWPAIWMLPAQARYGSWPAGGEIDIMELLGHEPNVVHGTLHWRDDDGHQFRGDSYTLPAGSFSEEFHIFAIEWEETEIRWYVDGELHMTQTVWGHRTAPYPAPFNQEFFLILNVAVGGNWPGSPDETTVFPQRMEIDYVRVYQKPADSNTN